MPIGEFTKLNSVKINGSSDCVQQHIPDVEGRVGNIDNGIYINPIVPRHVESVVLMSRAGSRLQVECIKDKAETKENI